jgi:outer membrane protein assembly factor BamB
MRSTPSPTLMALVSVLLGGVRAAAADVPWPQWRGPDGQGHAAAAHDLPVTWSEAEHVAWKTPLPGRGWSSPVLGDRHVWMTTAVAREATPDELAKLPPQPGNQPRDLADRVSLRALCVERDSGRLVHDVELLAVDHPQAIHKLNSYASPSPVLADGRLYCHFGDFGTACLDTKTATVVWSNRELRLEHMNGPGSTPVLCAGRLIVHCDGADVQYVAALDAATGTVAWRTPRSGTLRDNPDLKKSYGTPIVLSLGGRDVVVSPGTDWLYGYDPRSGEELWRVAYGDLGFSVVPRPVAAHGLVYLSTGFTKPRLLAVRPPAGDVPAEIVWAEAKGAPSMPSPLVVGEELYMVNDKGIATCLDARTGTVVWTQRLGGNFSSSPLHADGRIYVSNREGDTFVIAPGRTYELLATNRLDGQIFATPAAVGDAIFLRTDQALYRLAKRPAAGAAP